MRLSIISTQLCRCPGGPKPAGGTAATAAAQPESDNTLLFGVLTLILAVIALTLLQVNSNLKRCLTIRHPCFLSLFLLQKQIIYSHSYNCFISVSGYVTIQGAVGLGRQQKYEPEQPIFTHIKYMRASTRSVVFIVIPRPQEGKQANILR